MPFTQEQFIQIKQTYGKPWRKLQAPQGWKFTGEFRRSNNEEHFLGVNGKLCAGSTSVCRLILQPVPPSKKRYQVIYEETGETRQVFFGEEFLFSRLVYPNTIDTWLGYKPSAGCYRLLRRISTEAL